MLKTMKLKTQMMGAALMTGVMISAGEAHAASDLATTTEQVGSQANNLPQLINGVFYICGAGLVGLGMFGVKNHVDNPSNNKLPPALAKCGIGGALLATPVIADNALETITGGASDTQDLTNNTITIF